MADQGWDVPAATAGFTDTGAGNDNWESPGNQAPEASAGNHEITDTAGNDNEPAKVAPVVQNIPTPLEGWVAPKPYDYTDKDPNEWESNARVYEWDGDVGDVGPEFPDLELQLFGPQGSREPTHGIDFSRITEIEVLQEGPTHIVPIASFETAGLHPIMLANVKMARYGIPTPIQKYCIPAVHQGHDVIAIAQTGSGKTAAYLIPILNKLMGKAKKLAAPRPNPATFRPGVDAPARAEPLVVIVAPTRELAVQIFNEARKFCYRSMLRPCVVYGGGPIRDQIEQLQKGCDVLVASPGRLIDFIDRPAVLSLCRLRYMVIDEADEMLHSDWEEDFTKILCGGDQEEGNVNYMFFSATFPKPIRELAKTHLNESHVRIAVGRAGSCHKNIKQNVVLVDPMMKKTALFDLLSSLPATRTIIFVNNKRVADELDDFLYNKGVPCTSIHADRTQKEREASMRAFRAGGSPVLIATGVSARGIDVRNVMHVINYDLPSIEHGGIEEYTHRIGRTGRIGHRGLSTSFYTNRDEPIASVLTRTLLETEQEIPDFLETFKPDGDDLVNLKFEAEEDFDGGDNNSGEDGDDAFGGGGDDNNADEDGGAFKENNLSRDSAFGGGETTTADVASGW
ncbi:P-loop containing nucleoside triphosphate hydrolase protein [Lasiosphaeria hispida]|uniref:RNA helicase n=1 Tax=Lasiosphaeria hispida TaxID=260671 RepID=A0AAJ0MK66_9PEZI|nr:P-loop containing nucleoside triphosphate hydrolase protein [Lasiosphaeria hispida]